MTYILLMERTAQIKISIGLLTKQMGRHGVLKGKGGTKTFICRLPWDGTTHIQACAICPFHKVSQTWKAQVEPVRPDVVSLRLVERER